MLRRSFGTVKVFSLDRPRIRRALDQLILERYQPDPNVAAVYLFGSFARGNAVPGSDIDLLVVLRDDPRPPRERIVDYLPERFPVGVDIVPWTEAELNERLARGDRMAHTILTEGEALLDQRITHSPRA